jgi:hypothetical protein
VLYDGSIFKKSAAAQRLKLWGMWRVSPKVYKRVDIFDSVDTIVH